MTYHYDNGEVLIETTSYCVEMAVTAGSDHYETATLSAPEAREVAVALIKAAEELEARNANR